MLSIVILINYMGEAMIILISAYSVILSREQKQASKRAKQRKSW